MLPLTVADQVRSTLLDYLTTTFNFQDEAVEASLLDFLQDEKTGLFKGPYVNLRLPFRRAGDDDPLPLEIQPGFRPYLHQLRAFQRLSSANGHPPQPTLITTGTGSGKTECFLYPILDHCYRHREEPGVKALILYPMNALATDQAARLARILWQDERLRDQVIAGIYVGGESAAPRRAMGPEWLIDHRETLRDRPPDILLTNYRMLDFLLLRPEDRPLWANNSPDTLRYLVLDELHTYDGAQGSDVACLIRRLRARLAAPAGAICPVGTSATVGDAPPAPPIPAESPQEADAPQSAINRLGLPGFAGQVFGVAIGPDAVIGEDRLTPAEFLPAAFTAFDLPADRAALAENVGEPYDDYVERQCRAWFGPTLDPLALGAALRGHRFLGLLLAAVDGRILSLQELCKRMARGEPEFAALSGPEQALVVQSFLALIAHARVADGPEEQARPTPFLTLQVQLWVREMRRLMRGVADSPAFFWRDDAPDLARRRGLPPYYCRECGHSGWLALWRQGDERLNDQHAAIYNAWFERSRHCCYVYPGAEAGGLEGTGQRLCPHCLRVGLHAQCDECGRQTFPVLISRELSRPTGAKAQPRDLQRCPRCGTDNALSIVGSQAASLSSVAIGHLYTSPLNSDKKLLAFTDSVQDASHRAAFFGARTYRFNLRTAFQSVLEAQPDAHFSLENFVDAVLDYWRERWQERPDREQRLAAVFTPPDLRDEADYRAFIDDATRGSSRTVLPSALQRALHRRLSWEIAMEYAFNARLGRSLEKVGSSRAYVDPRRLGQALEALGVRLAEEIGGLDGLDGEKVAWFVGGLLERMRMRGGVAHEFLERYAAEQGSWFLLSKTRQPLLSPFHRRSRLPKLLTDSTRRDVFDNFRGGQESSWFVDWARRTLSPRLGVAEIGEVYRLTVEVLERRGLLRRYGGGRDNAWAIEPAALLLTAQTVSMRCDTCHDQQAAPQAQQPQSQQSQWLGAACLTYRCPGRYAPDPRPDRHYYRKLYSRGQVERIFSHEHTGLLDRQTREEVETQFKTQYKADAVNLLAATPTLEMGIDVGDLSGTMACSVPPATANYLQRIGRAGRATGNSLILTLANARPHDLYFFEDPLQMIAGGVTPPGCFLNAANMLKRQLFAFCLDRWTAGSGTVRFPRTVKHLLAQAERGGFPEPFLAFFAAEKSSLIDEFLALFGPEVGEEARAEVAEYAGGDALPGAIHGALANIRAERDELRRMHRRYREKLREIEADPAEYADPQSEITRLQRDAALVVDLIKEIEEQYILNFFTDGGLLPNYEFPESGVKFRALVLFDQPRANGKGYEVREYVRPAPAAIRELAPHNSFYAESRKLDVTHVEMPGREQALERWQFCDRCSHMALVQATHHSAACPLCGSPYWSDGGQQHNMLRFRQASAWARDYDSRVGDDNDDREQSFYQTERFFAIDPEQMGHAQLIPGLPFGFEYLREVTLREINFGPSENNGGTIQVAGAERWAQGFRVCRDCGVALPAREEADGEPTRVRHTRNCQFRAAQARWENIYLYREMQSEALRLLLPVSTMLVEETLASISAALHLGLGLWLGGDPAHLQILPHTEVGRDGTQRRFLVIYDTVPGGTGYLRDLAKPAVLRQVLSQARDALASCECRNQPERKACHRCLYSFRSQDKNALLDRALALTHLQEILDRFDERRPVHSLGDVDMLSVLESELEARFVDALAQHAQHNREWRWEPILHQGRAAWLLTVQGRRWRVEPQVALGYADGVETPTRPDFLFRPLDNPSRRPVAVYTDGFAFHVRPNDSRGQIADDLRKRRGLWRSGGYWVWSITWEDVAAFAGEQDKSPEPYLSVEQQLQLRRLKPTLPTHLALADGMQQLAAHLAQPDPDVWQGFGAAIGAILLNLRQSRPPVDVAVLDDLAERMRREVEFEDNIPPGARSGEWLYNFVQQRYTRLLVYVHPSRIKEPEAFSLCLRLQDRRDVRSSSGYEGGWRQFWLLCNLLQFLPGFDLCSQEGIESDGETEAAPARPGPGAPVSGPDAGAWADTGAWADAFAWADAACRPLLEQCQAASLPAPAVGWELLDDRQRVAAMAELAWEAARVAVFLPGQAVSAEAFAAQGWQTFHPDERDALLGCLYAEGRGS